MHFQASVLLSALEHLKAIVAEALVDLPPISEDVDMSLEDAKVQKLIPVYTYIYLVGLEGLTYGIIVDKIIHLYLYVYLYTI